MIKIIEIIPKTMPTTCFIPIASLNSNVPVNITKIIVPIVIIGLILLMLKIFKTYA